jgi:hypothetical protein
MKAELDDELKSGGDKEDNEDWRDVNVKNYAAIIGKAEEKWIDNPSDTDDHPETPDPNIDDDYYGDGNTGKSLSFTVPKNGTEEADVGDPDASSNDYAAIDSAAVINEQVSNFDDAVSKLDGEMESPYDFDDWEPDMGGDFYESIKDDQQLFYSDLSALFGFSNDGMSYTQDVDTSDIENPEKGDKEV